MWVMGSTWTRAVGPALALAALTACASAPAPISTYSVRMAANRLPPAPYDPSAPPRVLDGRAPLQCVPFARNESGIQIFGDANTRWHQAAGHYPRSNSPAPGSVLVMHGYHDDSRGHVAVVQQILSSRIIRVDHANWLNRGEISLGVPVIDVSPNNDWSEVRVWNVPDRHWGGRIYQADGFIHPFLLPTLLS
jgi:hypothetical protein